MNATPYSGYSARRGFVRRGGALALLLACVPVQAGDCTISVVPVSFGDYDPITQTQPVDATGSITADCTPDRNEKAFGVFVTIALGTGFGSYAARMMRSGTALLQYNLFTDAPRTTVWGDGSGGTGRMSGEVGGNRTGQPNPRTFPVFGRIPAGQDPAAGVYGDTVTVTVTF